MKVSDLTYSDVEIEIHRNKKNKQSMVTVLIYKDKINFEAYDTSDMDVESETKTKNRILKVLGFNDEFIGHYNAK